MTEKQDRFSHAMEQCRQAYRDIPTPPELEGAVEDAIQAGCRPRLPRRGLKRAAAAAAGTVRLLCGAHLPGGGCGGG